MFSAHRVLVLAIAFAFAVLLAQIFIVANDSASWQYQWLVTDCAPQTGFMPLGGSRAKHAETRSRTPGNTMQYSMQTVNFTRFQIDFVWISNVFSWIHHTSMDS